MVKLDEGTTEKNFPRGGGSDRPRPFKNLNKNESAASKKGLKRKAVTEDNDAKKAKEESSWIPKVDDDMFIEGLTGLGVVAEVFDNGLRLHTASSATVRIDVAEVSRKFGELINEGKIEMKDAFQVGQMVPFKVIGKKSGGGKVRATCNPAKLNKHLSPNMLVAGLVLNTAVTSIEEKGAILDIGLDQMTGFIEKSQFPAGGLREGLPLVVRILSTTSRVVKVTSFVEQDNLNMTSCEKLQLNHLMPGTILECEPTGDVVTAGVFVNIGNGLKGILPRRNLPPRLRENPEKLGKAIRAVVMFCQQNSKVLVLSAHPDIVAVSRIEKRISFEGVAIGDKIKCTVSDVIASKSIVYFTLPPVDGKKSLVTAFSSRSLLEKPDAVASEYEVGQEKLCRVTGYQYAGRMIVVSTRKDILSQKITTYQDAKCGDILEARVKHVGKTGVFFTVCGFVNAFTPISWLTDKPTPFSSIKSKFAIGTQHKVRVWQVCEDRRNLMVTCREQILALKGPSVASVEELEVGMTLPCVIRKIFPTGVMLLGSYNQITGVLRTESASKLPGTPKVNDFVAVNVEKIEENSRVVFVLKDAKPADEGSEKKVVQKPKAVDGDVMIGKMYSGALKAAKGEKANVTFTGEKKKEVFATVDDHLLSDLLDAPIGLTKRLLIENPETVQRIVPMGKLAAINRACVKRSVARFVKGMKVPKKFEDLKEEQVVVGVVGQIVTSLGVFVELVGGSGLVGRVLERKGAKRTSELLEVGQVVIGKIQGVDKDKKNFSIDPCTEMENGERVLEERALPLLESIAEEVKWLAEHSKLPAPGTHVEAKVIKELEDLTLVEFEHNGKKVAGVVHKALEEKEATSEPAKKKKKVAKKTLIVVDLNHSTNEVVLAALPKSSDSSETARIVAIRRDYLCAVSSNGLVYLPTRLHPNHLPVPDKKIKFHTLVDLNNLKSIGDGVFVATRGGGDVDDVARTKMVAKEFSEDIKKKENGESGSLKATSITNFRIYEGYVVGLVQGAPNQKTSLFAEIRLPGDTIGRLHVSELPPNLQTAKNPLEEFSNRNLHKTVCVRVINIEKKGKNGKIVELTMIPAKIQAGKIRAAQLSVRSKFAVGDVVRCFGAAQSTEKQELRVEVNPVWSGKISREHLPDDLKVKAADGGLEGFNLKKGEMREATVLAVDKKNKVLSLSLGNIKKEKVQLGATVTGRVFSVAKSAVRLKLSSGEQAILTPTAITDKYETVDDWMKEQLKTGSIVEVVCARITTNPKKYFMALKQRHEQEIKNERRRLVVDVETLKKGDQLDAIVENATKTALFVELGPGISGRIAVNEENEQLLEIGTNSVVRVTITKINEKKEISLRLDDILIRKFADRAGLKRAAKKEVTSKVEALDEKASKETVETEDPGFDWSNKGFRIEDLAAVGKLTEKRDDEDEENDSGEEEDEEEEEDELSDADEEEEGDSDEEEEENDEDAELIERSEEDHLRTVRGEPNSAIHWIEYMSLFVEKADLAAARKTAEEAISTIDPTESEERLKMWTAYLNLEVAYGDSATVQKVFTRACTSVNSYLIHKTLAKIYQKSDKPAEATHTLEQMVKKFRADNQEVWTLLAEHLMAQKDEKAARELIHRALSSCGKAQQQVQLISKFAQLEFRLGDAQRGVTQFEGLVAAHPKKTDLWLVYADAVLKRLGIEHARRVLERACNLKLSMHKMRPLYKKWLEMESRHGDAASVEIVKQRAEKFVQAVAENVLDDEDN